MRPRISCETHIYKCIIIHLFVISPWRYGELHSRHESRQLQPPDVQLPVWQAVVTVQISYNTRQMVQLTFSLKLSVTVFNAAHTCGTVRVCIPSYHIR